MSQQRWIWEINCKQAKNPPLLWTPGQTPPEVPNWGISDLTKMFEVLQKSSFLPPANEVCEGFVFTGVCPRGVCLPEYILGYTIPPGGDPPGRHLEDNPQEDTRNTPRHTPQEDTRKNSSPFPQGRHPTPRAEHAGRYGQQAGGTHPTGMHTCFKLIIVVDFGS